MHWADLVPTVEDWAKALAPRAFAVKKAAADLFTTGHVGYYLNPVTQGVAVFGPSATDRDVALAKHAASVATAAEALSLSYPELADPEGSWVKVAHSQTVRRLGELLNFFPGQYPGGIPNTPSPVAAMLTSGLLGAGLGYGAGKLTKRILPDRFGDNLPRALAIAGGLAGAVPGAAWAASNAAQGKSLLDPSPLNTSADQVLGLQPDYDFDREHVPPPPNSIQRSLGGVTIPASHQIKRGSVAEGDTFGTPGPGRRKTFADVNIDALGRTLWETGAPPGLAATTMGAMYAAQQLPDPNSEPGWATGRQLGQLAANAAGDYAKGYLVGAALNRVVGTPYSAPGIATGTMALGLIGAIVPKLFGR